jgi:hypothetical protein
MCFIFFYAGFNGKEINFYNLERIQKVIKLSVKFLLIAAMLCSVIGLACSSAPSSNNAAPSGDKVGVAECDEYIEKLEACMSSAPEASKGMLKTNLDTMKKTWKEAASTPQGKAGLATGCKSALDAAKQSFNYCKW